MNTDATVDAQDSTGEEDVIGVEASPFTMDEIGWLMSVRREIALVYASNVFCEVRYWQMTPRGLPANVVCSTAVRASFTNGYFHEAGEDWCIPPHTLLTHLVGRMGTEIAAGIAYDPMTASGSSTPAVATSVLLDAKSMFMIFKRRSMQRGESSHDAVHQAWEDTAIFLDHLLAVCTEISQIVLLEMYLIASFSMLEVDPTDYRYGGQNGERNITFRPGIGIALTQEAFEEIYWRCDGYVAKIKQLLHELC